MLTATWSVTLWPAHFTVRTCDPGLAVTDVLKDAGSVIA
jgi:hypothetical protein